MSDETAAQTNAPSSLDELIDLCVHIDAQIKAAAGKDGSAPASRKRVQTFFRRASAGEHKRKPTAPPQHPFQFDAWLDWVKTVRQDWYVPLLSKIGQLDRVAITGTLNLVLPNLATEEGRLRYELGICQEDLANVTRERDDLRAKVDAMSASQSARAKKKKSVKKVS